MNEVLNELAELFRQRTDIDRQILELIGQTVNDDSEEGEEDEEAQEPARKKIKRKPGKYNRRNPMPEEVKEDIRAKYAEGISQADLAEDFGVSPSTILKVLKAAPERATTKNKEVHDYVCVDGHEFKSKLAPGDVMCPICHTTDCDLGTLNGPIVE